VTDVNCNTQDESAADAAARLTSKHATCSRHIKTSYCNESVKFFSATLTGKGPLHGANFGHPAHDT